MVRSPTGRIAALDGIRALCILCVLLGHVAGTGIVPMHRFTHVFADVGVRGFFVLSGFLITSLLLRETAPPGEALRGFYLRRVVRIFPAFYVFLGGALVMWTAGWITVTPRDALFAATYTMNFHGDRTWSLGHLWSLAVEEQFYLLWPAALLLLRVRRATWVVAGALAASPLARLAVWYAWPAQRAIADQAFPCVFDALATGCLLAIWRPALERDPRYQRLLAARWFWCIPVAAVASLVITRPWIQLGVTATFANVALALAIHRCLARPAPRLVLSPVLVQIGLLSYSIYLWQQVFVNRHALAWYNRFPANLVLTFAAALVSYHLIEQPFLRLVRRRAAVSLATA